jgi:hypothetical protein
MGLDRTVLAGAAALILALPGTVEAQGRGNAGNDKPRPERGRNDPAGRPEARSQNARPQQNDRGQGRAQESARGRQGERRPEDARGAQQGRGPQNARPQNGRVNERSDRARPERAVGSAASARARGRFGDEPRAGDSGGLDEVDRRWAAAAQRPSRLVIRDAGLDRLPPHLRALTATGGAAGNAAAGALARGHEYNALPVNYISTSDGVRVFNARDHILFDISDDEVARLGYWDIRQLDPSGVRDGAPAFCRSGAGHPVWGREWCIDKGFGLGASGGWRWGRHRPDDVAFLMLDERPSLDRVGLIDVLGSLIFNRLALHAVTLGLADPLGGRWLGEPSGARVLTMHSGDVPVAELIDWDRDGRVDVMYVTSR